MAPLPPNNRARLWIDYTSCGLAHSTLLHLATGATTSTAADVLTALVPEMIALMASNDAITGARFSAAGSNVAFPISQAQTSGTASAWTDIDNAPRFISFVGRDTSGVRTKFTLFTPFVDPDAAGFRILTPSASAQDVLDVLVELSPPICTVGGGEPVWHSYQNQGLNSYWQRKMRKIHAA